MGGFPVTPLKNIELQHRNDDCNIVIENYSEQTKINRHHSQSAETIASTATAEKSYQLDGSVLKSAASKRHHQSEVCGLSRRISQRAAKSFSVLDKFLIIAYSRGDVICGLAHLMSSHSSRYFVSEFIVREKPLLHNALEQVRHNF
jgi:hypothetical protein